MLNQNGEVGPSESQYDQNRFRFLLQMRQFGDFQSLQTKSAKAKAEMDIAELSAQNQALKEKIIQAEIQRREVASSVLFNVQKERDALKQQV